MTSPELISLHGGHSGEFCCNAVDRLEEIFCAYIKKGLKTFGITEHIPPANDLVRFPDEIEQGLTARDLYQRFARYMTEVKRLKSEYQSKICIHSGMETDTCTGYLPHVRQLIQAFYPLLSKKKSCGTSIVSRSWAWPSLWCRGTIPKGQDHAGGHVAHAIEILATLGFDTLWPKPRLLPLNN